FADGDHRSNLYYFTDENIRRANAFLEKLRPLAEKKNASLTQLVLKWTISQPGITIALVGARNAEQAVRNASAANSELSAEEVDMISEELSSLELIRV